MNKGIMGKEGNKDKFRNKIMFLLMVMLIAQTVLLPVSAIYAEVSGAGYDGTGMGQFIEEGHLYVEEGSWDGVTRPNHDQELTTGQTASLTDVLVLEYLFELGPKDIAAIDKMEGETKRFSIECPPGLIWQLESDSPQDSELEIDLGAGVKKVFATLHIEQGNTYIQFVDNLADFAEGGIENAYFFLGCTLDPDKMDPPVGPEEYKFQLTQENEVILKIAENARQDSKLTGKKGTYENGLFTWTVGYQPGNKEAENLPLTLTDEFDHKYHEYVKGSFQSNGAPVKEADLIVDNAGGKTILKYKIPENTDAPITFTYQTALTDEAFIVEAEKTKVMNKAFLAKKNGEVLGKAVEISTEFDKPKWLQKEGVYIPEKKEIQWTVTINTNNKQLSKLILKDDLGEGRDHTSFKEDVEVKVKGGTNDGSPLKQTDAYTINWDDDKKGFTLHFQPKELQDLEPAYTVIYTTEIDKAYFYGNENQRIKNNAVLEYTWDNGVGGEYNPVTPPSIGVGVPVDGRLLQKSGSYNRSTHEITWKVEVNPHGVDVDSISLKDPIPQGQIYVQDSFASDDRTDIKPQFSDSKELKLEIQNLGEEKYAFTFKTMVDDRAHYAYNSNNQYQNTVTANAVIDEKPYETQATAKVNVVSKVLEKQGEAYDYSNNRITWKIEVNENKMGMQDVVLKDTLPEGLSYVEDSAKWEGDPITMADANGQTLEIPLGERADGKYGTVTYETKVDVNSEMFRENKEIVMKNEVSMERQGYDDGPNVKGEQLITNKMMEKEGSYEHEKGAIKYSVKLNPNGLALAAGTSIADQLPEGLQLDRETIKLYEAKVIPDGKTFEKEREVKLTADTLKVNVLKGTFSIHLPEGSARYVLEYAADVTDPSKAPFTNKISMEGTVQADIGSDTDEVNLGSGGGGGGGAASTKRHLTVIKVDAKRPDKKIEGVSFRLSDEAGVIAEETTDENGEVVFSYLKPDTTYFVTEVTPADGYQKMKAPKEITISRNEEDNKITIENEPVTGTIQFKKISDTKRPLSGAQFTATEKGGTNPHTYTAESGNDGMVVFEDLPFGSYEVKETKTPDQYHESSATVYEADIGYTGGIVSLKQESNIVKEVVNKSRKGTLVITKVDKETQEPLSGVSFTYTDSLGVSETTGLSDSNGEVRIENLSLGETYQLEENQYQDYRPIVSNITMTEEIQNLRLENEKMKEQLSVDTESASKEGVKITEENYPTSEEVIITRENHSTSQGEPASRIQEEKQREKANPQTGQEWSPVLPLAIAGGALLVMVLVLLYRRNTH